MRALSTEQSRVEEAFAFELCQRSHRALVAYITQCLSMKLGFGCMSWHCPCKHLSSEVNCLIDLGGGKGIIMSLVLPLGFLHMMFLYISRATNTVFMTPISLTSIFRWLQNTSDKEFDVVIFCFLLCQLYTSCLQPTSVRVVHGRPSLYKSHFFRAWWTDCT